jgi:AcrR family transcriptional regulator
MERAILRPKPTSARGARRPHAQRRDEAERRMIAAAVRIVAERGLDNLTLAECGEAAGYSRGLAAHYFGSKEELNAAIALRIVERYAERQRAAHTEGRSGFEDLCESVAFYLDSGRKDLVSLRAFHAVLGSALQLPALAAAVAALNRRSVDAFAAHIRRGVREGEIRAEVDPALEATLILASLRGITAQMLVDPRRIALTQLKRALLDNLRRCLCP